MLKTSSILFGSQPGRVVNDLMIRTWVRMVVVEMLVVDQSEIWLSTKTLDVQKNLVPTSRRSTNCIFWLIEFRRQQFYKNYSDQVSVGDSQYKAHGCCSGI